MTPERPRRVEEIVQAAMAIGPGAREAFLDRRCAGDRALRAEVARLIRERGAAEEGPETPVWSEAGESAEAETADEVPTFAGRRVGPYRLVRELGRGGMGAVYLGERVDGLFRQNVAIKLVKRGMDTDFILGRFRQERRLLASLNHPHIARLIDGGSTDDGLPYFVMELVEGSIIRPGCSTMRWRRRIRSWNSTATIRRAISSAAMCSSSWDT